MITAGERVRCALTDHDILNRGPDPLALPGVPLQREGSLGTRSQELAPHAARWVRPRRLQAWQKLLTRLDAVVDPYLLPALPRRYYTRAVMLFVK